MVSSSARSRLEGVSTPETELQRAHVLEHARSEEREPRAVETLEALRENVAGTIDIATQQRDPKCGHVERHRSGRHRLLVGESSNRGVNRDSLVDCARESERVDERSADDEPSQRLGRGVTNLACLREDSLGDFARRGAVGDGDQTEGAKLDANGVGQRGDVPSCLMPTHKERHDLTEVATLMNDCLDGAAPRPRGT